jgi:hypothetical protein
MCSFVTSLSFVFQCLSSVVIAVGPGFASYIDPVFSRCIRIIHSSLYEFQNHRSNPDMYPEPDKVFLVCALDLLSAITQGLGPASQGLYSASNPSPFPLLILALNVSTKGEVWVSELVTDYISGGGSIPTPLCDSLLTLSLEISPSLASHY